MDDSRKYDHYNRRVVKMYSVQDVMFPSFVGTGMLATRISFLTAMPVMNVEARIMPNVAHLSASDSLLKAYGATVVVERMGVAVCQNCDTGVCHETAACSLHSMIAAGCRAQRGDANVGYPFIWCKCNVGCRKTVMPISIFSTEMTG